MRERQIAMQIASTREFLKYFGTFFGLSAVVLTTGAMKKKNPAFLMPILPLSFVFTYNCDMGYGTMLQRIKDVFIPALLRAFCTLQTFPCYGVKTAGLGEAENILDTQSTLLELPKGPLTFEDLEKIRSQTKFFREK
ncbi:plasminogen receptor (KT) isoform X2 [Empidonax traillii]|uniref:plasminogen receptor (KT) isoform X2 n=1 Tax=Empidonax traillii TaxID=164674 RepID=UPI000FFD3F53|nr:plasminogen receptor (KT) isoform X2 [Empidonax traillii]